MRMTNGGGTTVTQTELNPVNSKMERERGHVPVSIFSILYSQPPLSLGS